MTRVLLIGGAGQLGTAIRRSWTGYEIVAPPHARLALEQIGDLRREIARVRPDVVVNAAAFHDVDRCEEEPERAFAVNAVAVGRAAQLAAELGFVFVTISTDYVFDGMTGRPYSEDAPARPLSIYGMSKLAGEHLALRADARVLVVRTCGVYGTADSSSRSPLIGRVFAHAGAREPLRVVDDVFVSPTFAGDLARSLHGLLATQAHGLYHAANAGPVSWYEFARAAVELSGVAVRVEPIPASQWKAPAVRPRFSALANAKLDAAGISMPSWRDGIAAYLAHQVR